MSDYISSPLNNSLTSNSQEKNQEKICNALGCYRPAKIEIYLRIGEKSATIFVCENCEPKFRDR